MNSPYCLSGESDAVAPVDPAWMPVQTAAEAQQRVVQSATLPPPRLTCVRGLYAGMAFPVAQDEVLGAGELETHPEVTLQLERVGLHPRHLLLRASPATPAWPLLVKDLSQRTPLEPPAFTPRTKTSGSLITDYRRHHDADGVYLKIRSLSETRLDASTTIWFEYFIPQEIATDVAFGTGCNNRNPWYMTGAYLNVSRGPPLSEHEAFFDLLRKYEVPRDLRYYIHGVLREHVDGQGAASVFDAFQRAPLKSLLQANYLSPETVLKLTLMKQELEDYLPWQDKSRPLIIEYGSLKREIRWYGAQLVPCNAPSNLPPAAPQTTNSPKTNDGATVSAIAKYVNASNVQRLPPGEMLVNGKRPMAHPAEGLPSWWDLCYSDSKTLEIRVDQHPVVSLPYKIPNGMQSAIFSCEPYLTSASLGLPPMMSMLPHLAPGVTDVAFSIRTHSQNYVYNGEFDICRAVKRLPMYLSPAGEQQRINALRQQKKWVEKWRGSPTECGIAVDGLISELYVPEKSGSFLIYFVHPFYLKQFFKEEVTEGSPPPAGAKLPPAVAEPVSVESLPTDVDAHPDKATDPATTASLETVASESDSFQQLKTVEIEENTLETPPEQDKMDPTLTRTAEDESTDEEFEKIVTAYVNPVNLARCNQWINRTPLQCLDFTALPEEPIPEIRLPPLFGSGYHLTIKFVGGAFVVKETFPADSSDFSLLPPHLRNLAFHKPARAADAPTAGGGFVPGSQHPLAPQVDVVDAVWVKISKGTLTDTEPEVVQRSRGAPSCSDPAFWSLRYGDIIRLGDLQFQVRRFNEGSAGLQGCRLRMEDEEIAIQDLNLSNRIPVSYYGVYDGHGGKECALFLKDDLHLAFAHHVGLLSGQLDADGVSVQHVIFEALYRSFVATDRAFLRLQMFKHSQTGPGGAAVVVVIAGSQIWCANTGDARCVVSRKGTAVQLSVDHKPDRWDEKQRIEGAGGFIRNKRILGRLAVSRAFGDIEYKNVGSQSSALVVADPEIRWISEISPDDEFLLLACDGLFDVWSSQDIVDHIKFVLQRQRDAQAIIEEIVLDAIEKRQSQDNVSATLILLH